jgi:hypothetical protein
MKKSIILLTVLLMAISSFSQSVSYPNIDRKVEKDVYIKSVTTTDYYTQITFVYKNTKSEGHYILLNLPGHKDAYYIRANGQRYNLLSTQNIGNTNGITAAMPGKLVEFSARFERLPSYTTQFDLIEGTSGTWDFYGVKLKESTTSNSSGEKFRIDYNMVSFYDVKTGTWSDFESGYNTFVININDNGDIMHIKANGEKAIYRKMSGVEEDYTKDGKHYQIINALDDDGDIFKFQIFDDTSIGLKMIYGNVMIQFAKS